MEKRTITKRELCERIAKETGLTQVAVKASVQGFLDAIIEELSNGNRLEFRDFGVFDSRVQAARKARNPRTGEEVHVPAKAIAYFKIGKKMEEVVQKSLANELEELEQSNSGVSAPRSTPSSQPTAPARPTEPTRPEVAPQPASASMNASSPPPPQQENPTPANPRRKPESEQGEDGDETQGYGGS